MTEPMWRVAIKIEHDDTDMYYYGDVNPASIGPFKEMQEAEEVMRWILSTARMIGKGVEDD